MNHSRYAFYLTGNVVLEEWLKYNISVLHFDYYTDWLNNVEAERAFGRMQKEAVALTELFPDLPESKLLKPRIESKFQAHRNMVTNNINQWGTAAGSLFDACDPRVNNLIWCPLQQGANAGWIVVVGWMTGFVMEAKMLEKKNQDLRYLEQATNYFRNSDGEPKTYFPIMNAEDFTVGGIGLEWWSPWVSAALKNPSAPGADFVLKYVKPKLDARFQHGCGYPSHFFCLNDSFRGY
jgi:hypothetical protein